MFCPTCGQRAPEGTKFCPCCGMDLSGILERGATYERSKDADPQDADTPTTVNPPATKPTPAAAHAATPVPAASPAPATPKPKPSQATPKPTPTQAAAASETEAETKESKPMPRTMGLRIVFGPIYTFAAIAMLSDKSFDQPAAAFVLLAYGIWLIVGIFTKGWRIVIY